MCAGVAVVFPSALSDGGQSVCVRREGREEGVSRVLQKCRVTGRVCVCVREAEKESLVVSERACCCDSVAV